MATLTETTQQNKTGAGTSKCMYCKSNLRTRVKRSLFVRTLLFWLPIKRYYCSKCDRKVHVWER